MSLPEPQVEKAAVALMKLWETMQNEPSSKKKTGQAELIKDEEFVSVVIALKQIPRRRGWRPRRMYINVTTTITLIPLFMFSPLAHTIFPNPEICIFTKDPQQSAKKLLLEDKPVDGVKKVYSILVIRIPLAYIIKQQGSCSRQAEEELSSIRG